MKNEDLDQDSAAEKMYGYPYASLSAWGKLHVDEVIAKMTKRDEPHTATLPGRNDHVSLRMANEKIAQENEQLRLENADLWQENADLVEQLAKLQSEWNQPSS